MWIPLYIIFCFSLVTFNILLFIFIFINLINMCLGVFLLGFILYRTLWTSCTCVAIFLSILRMFLTLISSNIFSNPFSLSSSGIPVIQIFVHLLLSQRSLKLFAILFSLLSLFFSSTVFSIILFSSSFICSSVSVILLLIPSRIFLSYCSVCHCLFILKF